MPFFDPAEQRVCVRIVYDGVGGAGKTTNLRKLCELFASQRAVSLYSPSEVDGRTVYFDWAQILAGSVCGFPLMCQVVSVPGQLVLTPRRRELLASADVIVLVCDSTSAGADAARFALGVLEESKRDARVGLLIQANKQDQPGVLAGPELLSRLGRESAPVVEAIATDGIGVIDTFVSALRLVSRAMQADTEDGRLHLDVRRAESAAEVLDRLRRQAVDPEWAAEMLLEEALTEMLVAGGTADRGAERSAKVAEPMLPTDDVLPGFIWPGQTGRAVLRTITRESREHTVPIDADGQAEHHAPGHVFRTCLDLRFEDREQARVALVAAARQHAQLGALLSPDAVLVAQPASDGAWWIWVSTPHATTVQDALAAGTLDPSGVAEQYGAAVVDALSVSVRHGLRLDLAPSSFTLAGETIRHVAP
ncbi:MAG TPA: hypothetical protein VL400_01750, partial [Polyangiaceae bacterium]|nr:hypothetical protein [Polyangiaceae bacterium]